MNIWAPVAPKPMMQRQQEDSPISHLLGLTLSVSSDANTLSPLSTVTQSKNSFLVNGGSGSNASATAGDSCHTAVSNGCLCFTPPDSPITAQTTRTTYGRTWSDDTGIAPLDVVRCVEHQKERTVQNMIRFVNRLGDVVWLCRPDAPCKVRKGGRGGMISTSQHQHPPTNAFYAGVGTAMQTQQVMLTTHGNGCATNPGVMTRPCCGGNSTVANCDTLAPPPLTFTAPLPAFPGVEMPPMVKPGTMFLLPVDAPPLLPLPSATAGPAAARVPFSGVVPHASTHSNFMWFIPHSLR